ncbi:MAG TPA: hypothetical protein PKK78_22825, partial [Kouleothrix sp.]|nr:hypothetical protein [Kouleothrix sp.]
RHYQSVRTFAYSSKFFFFFLVIFCAPRKKSPRKRKSTVLPQANKQVSESPIRFIPGFVHAQTKFGGEAAAEPSPYNKVCTGFGTPSLDVAMMRLKEQRRATRVFL